MADLIVDGMKRTLLTAFAAVSASLLGIAGFCIWAGWLAFGKPFSEAIDRERDFLLHKVDHQAVALACYDMMTNGHYAPLYGYRDGDDPRLPEAIRNLKSFWLDVGTNGVSIFQMGGHYHLGLDFGRRTSVSNGLTLVFFEEGERGHDVLLYSIPASK